MQLLHTCGMRTYVAALVLLSATRSALGTDPPFWGTVWVDPDIITPSDWSTFDAMAYAGIAPRFVFDRRDNAFSTKSMHLFNASFVDGLTIEVQVNSSDYAQAAAEIHAATYARMVGQLPTSMRTDVETMWIHGGGGLPFGGGNSNILVHLDVEPTTVPFLEEILFHEAAHTSYGPAHDGAAEWLAAQHADPNFISLYARDYPATEDVAESMLMWYGLRHRGDRLHPDTIAATEAAIPHRLAYFDALPFVISDPPASADFDGDGDVDGRDLAQWERDFGLNSSSDADVDDDSDGTDFLIWQRQFDAEPFLGRAWHAPEPSGPVVVALAVAGASLRRRLFD